jgi:hypothetical protein
VLSELETPTTDTADDSQAADPELLRVARAQRADLRVEDWADTIHEALVGLAATFERHIAVTEGDDGFLAEIGEHSPRLINAITRICEEHDRIRRELASTLAHIRRMPRRANDDDVEQLRDHVMELVTDLVRHRQHGADLVWEAHAVDIGGWE